MRLCEVRIDGSEGGARLVAVAEDAHGKRLSDVWFEYGDEYRDFVRADADVFVPMMLVGSMLLGEPFETDLAVSAQVAAELCEIQAIFTTWFPERLKGRRPQLAKVVSKPAAESRNTAAFFSAGVDAFYVVLKHRRGEGDGAAPLTHLVYMKGLEAPLSKIRGGKESRIAAIAEGLGLPVIMGRTNLRDCFDYEYVPYVCGPALASVALSLSGGLSRMLVPSGSTYRQEDLYPASTHPFLDRLWSTEYLEVRPDGGEATRARKTAYIASEPLVLENLSVCIENLGEFENCCRCSKCIRTMISLQALGVLERAVTFESPFDYELIRRISLDNPVGRAYFTQNIELARETGRDPRLTRALERHLRRWEKYRALVTLVTDTPLHPPVRRLHELFKRGSRRRGESQKA